MAYERENWENLPSTKTPVNADNLNKMDKGIANAVEKTGDTLTGGLLFENKNDYQAIRKTRTLNGKDYQLTVGIGGNGSARMEYVDNNDAVLSSVEARSDGIYNGVSGKKLVEKSDLLNLIYPVGSIYMSVNSTSPATLFGGTWEQIKGRFLLGTGSLESNNNNRFGQVTAGQVNVPAGEKGGETYHKLTINEMPKHKHNTNVRINWYNGTAFGPLFNQGDSSYVGVDRETTYTDEVGGNNSHNNIPPYFAVNIWKRTA